jgi:LPS-assembly protein
VRTGRRGVLRVAVSCREAAKMLRLLAAVAACLGCMDVARAQQPSLQTRGGETTVAKQVTAGKGSPLLLQADDLVYDNRNNRVIARGHVEIYYNDNVLLADEIVYDKNANTLSAVGNVRLKESDGAVVNADRLTLSSDFRDGFIRSMRALTSDEARIAAQNAYRKDGKTIFESGVVTACKPCEAHPERPPLWRVKATRVIHDKEEQKIFYENAQFELFGVPVAWIPYFYTPDPTVKQQSGFMAPHWGSSASTLGYYITAPFYWAISPEYDLTLSPTFTTKAGYLVQADWRQRLWNGAYEVKLAGAYNDSSKDFWGDRNWRGSVETKGDFELNKAWHFGWNAIVESDDTFRRFYKIDDVYATERVSQIYLTGLGERNYFNLTMARYGNLTGDTYFYETNTVQKTVTATAYPSLDYNYIHNKPVLGGELSVDVNALALSVTDPATSSSQVTRGTLDHIVTQAQWRRTLTDELGERFTPFFMARGDLYNTSRFVDVDGASGPADTFTRQMVGAGLDYRYPFVSHSENASHVIEPVAQIISRAGGSNSHVPNEDSRSLVFDDTLLFDTDKFSGYDRMETGTRANYGVQYTYQMYNGFSARAVGGESMQVGGDNPYDPTTGLGGTRSDYVFGGYFDYMNRFRLLSQMRLSEQDFSVLRQSYSAQTKLGFFEGSLSYVAVAAQPLLGFPTGRDEVAGFAAVKLNDDWTVFGDLRFDIKTDQWVRNSAGVQYADECFILSVTYQQTYINYLDIVPDTSVIVRVGFKGFGQQTAPSSIGDLSPEAASFR